MNALKQTTWLFVALLLMICMGWYMATSSPKLHVKLDAQALSMTTDAVITQLYVHQFNADGHLLHYLHTPHMEHIPFNNTHTLQTPHIVVIKDNQAPWTIHAQLATALKGGEQIILNKNVVIHQDKDKTVAATTLTTEEITYFPKTKIAKTDKEITLVQAENRVDSSGMNAYLAENRVELLHNARGTYAPTDTH